MVNKWDWDEVEVVQLCKGGCHDIPGIVSLQLRQETPWLGSGRGPMCLVRASWLLPLLCCYAQCYYHAMDRQVESRVGENNIPNIFFIKGNEPQIDMSAIDLT